MKRLSILMLAIILLALNYVLLRDFNTLVWPYLWPRPGIFIFIGFFVMAMWFRQLFSGIWKLRLVGLGMIFIGQSYLIHSFQIVLEHFSVVALAHLIGVTGTFLVMTLNYINQITPKHHKKAPPLPADLPYVAAVVPTYGEPYDILEKTVVHLKQLDYPVERLYILISDDGHREEIRHLAELHGVHYNPGARKDAKAGNLNSALEHLEKHFPQATLILTQDADEVIASSFLQKTVGYFEDPKLAFVQTPKEAFTPAGDPFGNRDRIFYDILQPGRNGSGAAFSCGSGVVWRIAAVKSIGGFATWNLVEDMTTSYFLHSAGYRSEYHNEVLTVGLSPDDIPGLLKQRGTWAADTWRFLLFNNPLRRPGLSLRQRLQYLELGMFYVASTLFIPALMLTPVLSLATRDFIPIEGSALFPWLAASSLYYIVLARGRLTFLLRMWQYWVGHWPTYTKAFWIAVRSRHKKPSYKVTRKTRQSGFYGQLIWPQILYIFLGAILIIRGLFWLPDASLSDRLTNIGVLLYYMYMVSGICKAAFYGVSFSFLSPETKGREFLRQMLAGLASTLRAAMPIQSRYSSELGLLSRDKMKRGLRVSLFIPVLTIIFVFLYIRVEPGGELSIAAIGPSNILFQKEREALSASAPETISIDAFKPPVASPRSQATLVHMTPPTSLSATNGPLPTAIATSTPISIDTATPLPTFTSLPPDTPTLTFTPTATPLPTDTLTPAPTPTNTPIPADTSVPIELLAPTAPISTATPVKIPTPATKYSAPVLAEPGDNSAFIPGNTIVLRWQPVGELAPTEQYAVRLIYRHQNEIVYKGAQVRETEWTVPLSLFSQADGPEHLYEWFVVVEHLNDEDVGIAISPESQKHRFTWK